MGTKAMLERTEEVFKFFIKDFNASTANTTGNRLGTGTNQSWCAPLRRDLPMPLEAIPDRTKGRLMQFYCQSEWSTMSLSRRRC